MSDLEIAAAYQKGYDAGAADLEQCHEFRERLAAKDAEIAQLRSRLRTFVIHIEAARDLRAIKFADAFKICHDLGRRLIDENTEDI